MDTQPQDKYFETAYQELIFLRSYARWKPDAGRREYWEESVDRYVGFLERLFSDTSMKAQRDLDPAIKIDQEVWARLKKSILEMKVLPSMRALQFAGPALERNDMCAYNCSFLAIDRPESFVNIMYISLCGTGVGYSVELKHIEKLPIIKNQGEDTYVTSDEESSGSSSLSSSQSSLGSSTPSTSSFTKAQPVEKYTIEDSREGWADALRFGLEKWFNGGDCLFDYSCLRPKGAPLKTTGGRSSGPEPLKDCLDFIKATILSSRGKKLTSVQCLDIACKIGDCVVTGGVRRTAMICLYDRTDSAMKKAKKGTFYKEHPYRCSANISAVYNSIPDDLTLMEEWTKIIKSNSGEPGIFNRASIKHQIPRRRVTLLKKSKLETIGTNPCGEVLLLPDGLCNLSTVVARATDTEEDLLDKIEVATIIGTFQSCLIHLPYVSGDWRQNAKMERLLGVSITGQQDCPVVRDAGVLQRLKARALKTNEIWADFLKINRSSSITLTKPEGTCSQLVNSSSGIHLRWSKYYIRRVRIAATDPLAKFLISSGVPYHPENMQQPPNVYTWVFEFPMKSPDGARTRDEVPAVQMLDYWLLVKRNYCEHNPSATITFKPDEIIDCLVWLRKNWNYVGGLTFFPYSDHVYPLAPYEEISEETYSEMISSFPQLDFKNLPMFEKEDTTQPQGELACVADKCEENVIFVAQ